MTATDRPRPGRKRSAQSRQAILLAALELLAESGYAALTIEGIATRSGTGKQTIYRWWPSKADVLLDALATKADLHIPIEEHGSYAGDLRAFLQASFKLARTPPVREVLRALMAHAQLDPAFAERFRASFIARRRAALTVLLDRARDRGDLPTRPEPGTVCDLVFGVIWYRVLATDAPLDAALVNELLAILAPEPSPSSTTGGSREHDPDHRRD
jgi:AcrR family transcriptional regulator